MLSPDRPSRSQHHRKSDRCLSSSVGPVPEIVVEIGVGLDTGVVVGTGHGKHSGPCSAAGWVAAEIALPSLDKRLAGCSAAAPNAAVTPALYHGKYLVRCWAAVAAGNAHDSDWARCWAVDSDAGLNLGTGLRLRLGSALGYEKICAVGLSAADRGIARCVRFVLDIDSELEIDWGCEAVAVQ